MMVVSGRMMLLELSLEVLMEFLIEVLVKWEGVSSSSGWVDQ